MQASEVVFVVDDDPAQQRLLAHTLHHQGLETETFASGDAVLQALQAGGQPGCVILDLRMPGLSGEETLAEIRRFDPDLPVIISSGQDEVEVAVRVMKEGAYDYLVKPIEPEELGKVLRHALERRRMSMELSELRRQVRSSGRFDRIVGRAPTMKRVFRLVEKTLRNDITVLIMGASGSGKELVARAIHQHGVRAEKPFVVVNCAAIPKELIESELFGHEKGAFTGAQQRKIGKFELADSGTLFLDELGELELPVQAKLLRALQEREIERVGGTKTIPVDVRIVAATKRNLPDMVEAGEFREDLYYRINTFTIELPDLAQRREDIPVLANHFVDKHRSALGREDLTGVSREAMRLLLKHDWPGNIRELENAISRAIVMCEGNEIQPGDLSASLQGEEVEDELPVELEDTELLEEMVVRSPEGGGLIPDFNRPEDIQTLEEVKERVFRRALEVCDGNTTMAADRLGIGRATAFRFIDKYNIREEEEGE